jgi:Flp pilus assembly protein CpaB
VKTTRKRLARPSLRSVLATRHGALAVSLACALLTIVIVVIAIGQAQHPTKAAAPQQATVLVATSSIAKGTSAQTIATQHLYKEEPVLQTQVSPAAVSNAASLAGTVAAADILPGQQLTTTDFAVTHGAIAQLLPSQRAIAVTLDNQHGLTGAIQAGDHVDVYGSFSSGSTATVALLYADATVLKPSVGAGAGSGSSGSTTTGAGTTLLAVDKNASANLAYTADNGKLWLVLRPTSSTNPSQGLTTIASILGGRQVLTTIKPTLGGH